MDVFQQESSTVRRILKVVIVLGVIVSWADFELRNHASLAWNDRRFSVQRDYFSPYVPAPGRLSVSQKARHRYHDAVYVHIAECGSQAQPRLMETNSSQPAPHNPVPRQN